MTRIDMHNGLAAVAFVLVVAHLLAVFAIAIGSWWYMDQTFYGNPFLQSPITRWVSTGYLMLWALGVAFLIGSEGEP